MVDQFRKTVGADLAYAWFPVNERPTVDVSASREGINLLGALTETGEDVSGVYWIVHQGSHYLVSPSAPVQVWRRTCRRVGHRLILHSEQSQRIRRGNGERELLYLPTGMAKFDPTEECWRQLRTALGNRYFGSLDELRAGIQSALETINPPEIYQYLCR